MVKCSSLFCSLKQRLNIIIVSEGAIDRDGNPITADAVKKVLLDWHLITTDLWTLGCCGQVETGHKGDSVGTCSGLSPLFKLRLSPPSLYSEGRSPLGFWQDLGLPDGSWGSFGAHGCHSWHALLCRQVKFGHNFLPSKCVSDNAASSIMLLSLAWTAMLLLGFLWWHVWKKLRYRWNHRIGRHRYT